MKALKYITGLALLLAFSTGCKKTTYEDVSFVSTAAAPDQLNVLFEITQDNTGLVTITPNGAGAVKYDVYYGHGGTTPVKVLAGKNTTHTYPEGVYTVKIVGYSVNGKTTELTKQLTVSFRAPENLDVTTAIDASSNFKLNVSATALYETNFRVFFGDVPNEVGLVFLEGQTVSHTYTAVGTYTVKVVAYSGGAATTQVTRQITIVDPLLLPITFESPTINYAFSNFDGGNATVVANPQANGINTSAKVGKMVKGPGGQVWGGSWIGLSSPIDFSVNKVFRMKVWSPRAGAKVLLKVENGANTAQNFEKEATTSIANGWEDLVFDYNGINTANPYNHIVLIFELGTVGDGSANYTFYFDDIRLTNSIPGSLLNLPVTFDLPGINYAMVDFGGNNSVTAADPANAANNVKKTTKPNGAETWAGTTIGAGFTSPLAFSATATQMTVRVYSPAVGLPIRLKVEDRNDNTHSVETEKLTTVANAWETLVFDFRNQASGTAALNLAYTYNMASLFFDFGTAGSGKVFYWDDVTFLPVNIAGLELPLTFESGTLNYAFTNFDGGDVTIINNPQSGGINTSAKVGKMVKNAGQPWGGSWIALDAPISFGALRTFKMKVWSPRVGAKVLLKVENLTNGAISFEKEVTTTVANQWEELTFDYTGINVANSYQKVVLIFDLGTMGDGSPNYTFYFDDIKLN